MSDGAKIAAAVCIVVLLVAVALTVGLLAAKLIERSGYKLSGWQRAAIGVAALLPVIPP